jgi:hypothetical protein
MCDLHLAIYMLLYVYVAYPGNATVKSWLALGCNRQPGCPWGYQIGDAHIIHLLLVPQWPQMIIKLVTC